MKSQGSTLKHRYLIQQRELFGDRLYTGLDGSNFFVDKEEITYQSITLDDFDKEICHCQKCQLGKNRTNFVFGVGDPNGSLMLVGEAPGEQEDLKGEPFVGPAGKLLDKILTAIDKKRDKGVYIANVIKCRPPNNRDPLPSEVEKCEPYLIRQIKFVKPKLIVALGRVAGKTLLKQDIPLKHMRSKTFDYCGTPLRVTYHPAALLRNPGLKAAAWEDFKFIREFVSD
jgi:DNA polymerase|tara:strand:- start:25095 stop:25775 length:681 start_codon:yes stop_codon:yes gene_type:complete